MSITSFSPFFSLNNHFNGLARAQDIDPAEGTWSRLLTPRINLQEGVENNFITATFELSGLTKDKVNIDVQKDHLTVFGEVTESSERDQDGYKIKKRRSGKFSRTLQVPVGTQSDAVKASVENGVLTVTFPKSSPGQEPQQTKID